MRGMWRGALRALKSVDADPRAGVAEFKRLSALYTQLGRHQESYRCASRALEASPQSLNSRFLVASTAIAVGEMDRAEKLLDEILDKDPTEGDLYYNRATVRKQTADDNHVDEIRYQLALTREGDPREVPLCYALGKELEDMGERDESFAAFARGGVGPAARAGV